ncbi:MAG: CBS domain-containing protein, partial [Candidatus Bathyarchaeia archaeon]
NIYFTVLILHQKITGGYMALTGFMLKKLRLEAKLTQKKLAELVGVSQAHIAKIEQGKVDPRLSTVNKILQVLTESKEKKCGDLMTREVLFARPDDSVLKVSEIMMRHAISQMPVIDGHRVVGTITEESIIRKLGSNIAGEKVENIMDPPLPMVSEEASVSAIRPLLERRQGVLVVRGGKVVGIITRSDFLKTIG